MTDVDVIGIPCIWQIFCEKMKCGLDVLPQTLGSCFEVMLAVTLTIVPRQTCRAARKAADNVFVICNAPCAARQFGLALATADLLACKQPAGACAGKAGKR